MRDVVITEHAPQAIGPYSQAIKAGGFIFVSGQIPIDPTTGLIAQSGFSFANSAGKMFCRLPATGPYWLL